MEHGFIKVAAATPKVKVADLLFNAEEIVSIIEKAEEQNVELLLFPELSITSCSCGDLYRQQTLLEYAKKIIEGLVAGSEECEAVIVVGVPVAAGGTLLNCAIVIWHGEIMGIVPQYHIPSEGNSSQKRWFTSASELPEDCKISLCGKEVEINSRRIFTTPHYTFAIEFGSDLMSPAPTSTALALRGAEIVLCPASHCETVGVRNYIELLCRTQSARNNCGYIYSSCGYGESSGDAVFAGNSFIVENGAVLAKSERFSMQSQLVISEIDVEKLRHDRMANSLFADAAKEFSNCGIAMTHIAQEIKPINGLTRKFEATPFVPQGGTLKEHCNEIFNIQALGLAKRIEHTHSATAVIGISGGLDSTLALLVTVKTFDLLGKDRKDIIAITMPGFGTTDRTYNNAIELMKSLGVTIREISIKDACIQHFKDIGHDITKHDVTYENSQARERTQILMDVANQMNGLVIGTGDLSELALGWATYNGDHMSMYGVNAAVPKTLIRHIVRIIAEESGDASIRTTLLDIVDTPISPELTPADDQGNIKQKTEDLVGPYELHDFFLYHTLRNAYGPKKIYYIARQTFRGTYDDATIKKWLTIFFRRFFMQQFKRSCMPDGPKVGSCGLSPRGGWIMPTDACSTLWLEECEAL